MEPSTSCIVGRVTADELKSPLTIFIILLSSLSIINIGRRVWRGMVCFTACVSIYFLYHDMVTCYLFINWMKVFDINILNLFQQENHRSLSQNFSGTLLLMTSAIAAIVSSGVPLVTGCIIGDDPVSSWEPHLILV